jgi:hypothetical protein
MGDFKTLADLTSEQICKEKITNSKLEGIISKAKERNEKFIFASLFHRPGSIHTDKINYQDEIYGDSYGEASEPVPSWNDHEDHYEYLEHSESPSRGHTDHTEHSETVYTERSYSESSHHTDSSREDCDYSESVHTEKG